MQDCDNCGTEAELYHNEASGLAFCEDCDMASEDEAEGTFHAELRQIIQQVEGTPLAVLIPQAEALLALPEESVAALHVAAVNMVEAASLGR